MQGSCLSWQYKGGRVGGDGRVSFRGQTTWNGATASVVLRCHRIWPGCAAAMRCTDTCHVLTLAVCCVGTTTDGHLTKLAGWCCCARGVLTGCALC